MIFYKSPIVGHFVESDENSWTEFYLESFIYNVIF